MTRQLIDAFEVLDSIGTIAFTVLLALMEPTVREACDERQLIDVFKVFDSIGMIDLTVFLSLMEPTVRETDDEAAHRCVQGPRQHRHDRLHCVPVTDGADGEGDR